MGLAIILVLANVITADMGMWPGLGLFSPALGLPLSMLAGVLERPFYTTAGVKRHAVWYALQANLISLVAGYLLIIPFGAVFDAVLVLAWPPVAIALSIIIERHYLKARGVLESSGRWLPIILGNLFSAGVCILIPLPTHLLYSETARLFLLPYSTPLTWFAGIGSAAVFVFAFIVPARTR